LEFGPRGTSAFAALLYHRRYPCANA